jgi:hypothetical protein
MRIVTRPDFDGVVCAVLLLDVFEGQPAVVWAEPNELQKGLVPIQAGDIIANLPYHEACELWFDHHYTNRIHTPFKGCFELAPSAAGLIFEHYSGQFSREFGALVHAADRIDSADLTMNEVLHPESNPFILLSMTISSEHAVHDQYWDKVVELLLRHDIEDVIEDPEVNQRCQSVLTQNERYAVYLRENTCLVQHVSVTDFRGFDAVPVGNRFLVYCLYPEAMVNLRIHYEDRTRQTVVVHAGHSIFNRNCRVNLGLMLTEFGGGGHRGAASSRFPVAKADQYIAKITDTLVKNENNEILPKAQAPWLPK